MRTLAYLFLLAGLVGCSGCKTNPTPVVPVPTNPIPSPPPPPDPNIRKDLPLGWKQIGFGMWSYGLPTVFISDTTLPSGLLASISDPEHQPHNQLPNARKPNYRSSSMDRRSVHSTNGSCWQRIDSSKGKHNWTVSGLCYADDLSSRQSYAKFCWCA